MQTARRLGVFERAKLKFLYPVRPGLAALDKTPEALKGDVLFGAELTFS